MEAHKANFRLKHRSTLLRIRHPSTPHCIRQNPVVWPYLKKNSSGEDGNYSYFTDTERWSEFSWASGPVLSLSHMRLCKNPNTTWYEVSMRIKKWSIYSVKQCTHSNNFIRFLWLLTIDHLRNINECTINLACTQIR